MSYDPNSNNPSSANPYGAGANPSISSSNPYGNPSSSSSNPYGNPASASANPYSNPYGATTVGSTNPYGGSSSGPSNPQYGVSGSNNPYGNTASGSNNPYASGSGGTTSGTGYGGGVYGTNYGGTGTNNYADTHYGGSGTNSSNIMGSNQVGMNQIGTSNQRNQSTNQTGVSNQSISQTGVSNPYANISSSYASVSSTGPYSYENLINGYGNTSNSRSPYTGGNTGLLADTTYGNIAASGATSNQGSNAAYAALGLKTTVGNVTSGKNDTTGGNVMSGVPPATKIPSGTTPVSSVGTYPHVNLTPKATGVTTGTFSGGVSATAGVSNVAGATGVSNMSNNISGGIPTIPGRTTSPVGVAPKRTPSATNYSVNGTRPGSNLAKAAGTPNSITSNNAKPLGITSGVTLGTGVEAAGASQFLSAMPTPVGPSSSLSQPQFQLSQPQFPPEKRLLVPLTLQPGAHQQPVQQSSLIPQAPLSPLSLLGDGSSGASPFLPLNVSTTTSQPRFGIPRTVEVIPKSEMEILPYENLTGVIKFPEGQHNTSIVTFKRSDLDNILEVVCARISRLVQSGRSGLLSPTSAGHIGQGGSGGAGQGGVGGGMQSQGGQPDASISLSVIELNNNEIRDLLSSEFYDTLEVMETTYTHLFPKLHEVRIGSSQQSSQQTGGLLSRPIPIISVSQLLEDVKLTLRTALSRLALLSSTTLDVRRGGHLIFTFYLGSKKCIQVCCVDIEEFLSKLMGRGEIRKVFNSSGMVAHTTNLNVTATVNNVPVKDVISDVMQSNWWINCEYLTEILFPLYLDTRLFQTTILIPAENVNLIPIISSLFPFKSMRVPIPQNLESGRRVECDLKTVMNSGERCINASKAEKLINAPVRRDFFLTNLSSNPFLNRRMFIDLLDNIVSFGSSVLGNNLPITKGLDIQGTHCVIKVSEDSRMSGSGAAVGNSAAPGNGTTEPMNTTPTPLPQDTNPVLHITRIKLHKKADDGVVEDDDVKAGERAGESNAAAKETDGNNASCNGGNSGPMVFLNGVLVRNPNTSLQHGDKIMIGTFGLVFQIIAEKSELTQPLTYATEKEPIVFRDPYLASRAGSRAESISPRIVNSNSEIQIKSLQPNPPNQNLEVDHFLRRVCRGFNYYCVEADLLWRRLQNLPIIWRDEGEGGLVLVPNAELPSVLGTIQKISDTSNNTVDCSNMGFYYSTTSENDFMMGSIEEKSPSTGAVFIGNKKSASSSVGKEKSAKSKSSGASIAANSAAKGQPKKASSNDRRSSIGDKRLGSKSKDELSTETLESHHILELNNPLTRTSDTVYSFNSRILDENQFLHGHLPNLRNLFSEIVYANSAHGDSGLTLQTILNAEPWRNPLTPTWKSSEVFSFLVGMNANLNLTAGSSLYGVPNYSAGHAAGGAGHPAGGGSISNTTNAQDVIENVVDPAFVLSVTSSLNLAAHPNIWPSNNNSWSKTGRLFGFQLGLSNLKSGAANGGAMSSGIGIDLSPSRRALSPTTTRKNQQSKTGGGKTEGINEKNGTTTDTRSPIKKTEVAERAEEKKINEQISNLANVVSHKTCVEGEFDQAMGLQMQQIGLLKMKLEKYRN